MKKEILKAVSAVLAVVMTASVIASCGKSGKEPAEALIASETYSEVTVQALEQEELDSIVQEVLGEEKWDGDFKKLDGKQRAAVEQKLTEKGYTAEITDNGVAYYAYTPTADEKEIAEVVQEVLGEKKWDGKYATLSDSEKIAAQKKLQERGYDVELGESGFEFYSPADRRAETTKFSYDMLPSKNQIAGAVADVLGVENYAKWDGKLLSLTKQQQADILKALNNYGFDLAINDKGELYMVHNPQNKVTFDTAYDSSAIGGTTQAPTTVKATEPESETENVTGTTASSEKPAPVLERTGLSTFGGAKGGDSFYDVAATADGGYVAVGRFFSADGEYAGTNAKWEKTRSVIVRFDKNGAFQWKATFGGSSLNAMTGVLLEKVAVLTDGSIVAVGSTDARSLGVVKDDPGDALIVKVSADGTNQKVTRVAGTMEDMFVSVCATPDGGFLVGGSTRSSDGDFSGLTAVSRKAILMKYTADVKRTWMRSMTSGSNAAQFNALAVTDEGYIYANCFAALAVGSKMQLDMAYYAGFGGNDNILFKFNPDGELLTHQAIAGSGTDQVNAIAVADGGVIVGGVCGENVRADSVFAGKHNYGAYDAFLVRLSATLQVEWVQTYGGLETEAILGVVPIKGGYAVTGYSQSNNNDFKFLGSGKEDAFVMTVSENGTTTAKYALRGTDMDYGTALAAVSSKKLAVVGRTKSTNTDFISLTPAPAQNPVSFIGFYEVQ